MMNALVSARRRRRPVLLTAPWFAVVLFAALAVVAGLGGSMPGSGQIAAAQEAPLPPSGLSVGAITQTSLTVSWNAPSGATVTGYELQRSHFSRGRWTGWWTRYRGSDTSKTFSGLASGSDFRFRVRSVAGVLKSGWTPAVSGSTAAKDFSAPRFGATTATSIEVHWAPPAANHGLAPISSYMICYDDGLGGSACPEYDVSRTSVALTGLSRGASHRFYFIAISEEDQWFVSDESTHSTLAGAGAAPQFSGPRDFVVAERTLAVGTVAASDPDAEDQVQSFALSGADAWLFLISDAGELRFNNAYYTPSYEYPSDHNDDGVYELTIAATSGVGVREQTTSRGYTVTVADVAEVQIEAGQERLRLRWEPVAGAITYKVQWKSGAQEFDAAGRQATIQSAGYTIPGLTGGTAYTVRVIGVNTDGDGPPSPGVVGTPLWPPPGDLAIAEASQTSITVSWSAPPGASVSEYELQRRHFARGRWSGWWTRYEGGEASKTFAGLGTSQDYRFRVRADVNGAKTAWSQPVSGSTAALDFAAPTFGTTTTTSVELRWAPPASNHGMGEISSYLACVRDEPESWACPEYEVGQTSVVVENLVQNTSYEFRFVAIGERGQWLWSETGTHSTLAGIGAPPQFSGETSFIVAERTLAVGTIAASDPDAEDQVHSLELSGADAWLFIINNAGELRFGGQYYTPDFEHPGDHDGDGVYDLTINATSGVGQRQLTASRDYTVTVADVAELQIEPGVRQLALTWEPVAAAMSYKVQWKSGEQEFGAAEREATVQAASYTITDLNGRTPYTVRVIGVNPGGDGPPSPGVVGTPLPGGLVPSFGANVIADQTWTIGTAITAVVLPAATGGNGALSYRLVGEDGARLPQGLTVVLPSEGAAGSISGTPEALLARTEFRLVASDADLDGAALVFHLTVGEDPANMPTDVTLDQATQTSLRVSWTAPASGTVTDYDVRWRSAAHPNWRDVPTETATSATITGLGPGAAYEVQVRAEVNGSESAWTLPVRGSTLARDFAAPTYGETTTTSIVVNWLPPAANHGLGLISQFQLCVTDLNANRFVTSCTSMGTSLTTTLTDLTPGGRYRMSLLALATGGVIFLNSERSEHSTPSEESEESEEPEPTQAEPPTSERQSAVVDYDADGDNLIEISNLDQLNAVRWDLDGDGRATVGAQSYAAAFPGAATGMGCSSTCIGYELTADLDFSGSAYAAGAGWAPLGYQNASRAQDVRFTAVFEGNGHAVRHLFINRPTTSGVGLFGVTAPGSEIRGVGVDDADVTGYNNVGALVGQGNGDIRRSWSTGSVTAKNNNVGGILGHQQRSSAGAVLAANWSSATISGRNNVGGLVGIMQLGAIIAGYATGGVTCVEGCVLSRGGLVGSLRNGGSVAASYSTGAVTPTSGGRHGGGLIGELRSGHGGVADSYWDTQRSGVASDGSGQGSGQTTSALRAPSGYNGIYANWNVDLDGDGQGDNPWRFGAGDPTLRPTGGD